MSEACRLTDELPNDDRELSKAFYSSALNILI